ncbi:MAG: PKD domain-containing protein, partial [Bacteroidetes bacterium]|nr:PKD domain-containing protein [Bacteroidota bacterium]
MIRHFTFLFFCLIIGGIVNAQTPQSPSFHGGDINKVLDFRRPQNNTITKNPEHDFSRQNPRFRSLMPKERKCVTVEMEGELRTQHAKETENDSTFENWIDGAIQRMQTSRSTRRAATTVFTLPVVVHIIYSNTTENISDEQILSQIEVLNQDYRRQNPDQDRTPREFKKIATDTEIEFCMASVDPDGNPTNGIDRISISGSPFSERFINEQIKPTTIWNPDQYLNIWVCNISGGILGFAQFPTSSALTGLPVSSGSAQTDGVVINYNTFGTTGTVTAPFDKGRTVTHEIGHWLGLRHIWGDGPCGVDDFCEDTPETNGANFACPPGTVGCDGTTAMVQNFMDYTDDACMNLFTTNQKQRMRAVLENSPRRSSLVNSTVCTPPATPPVPRFISDITTGCGPLTVNFTDHSEGEPKEYEWFFDGGKPSRSKNPNVEVTYKKPGDYSVSLRVANPGGSRSLQKDQLVHVVEKGRTLPVKAGFEPGAPFPPEGFIVHNPDRDTTWNKTEKLGAKGKSTGSLYIDNYENNLKDGADWLLTPIMDFSSGKGSFLSFDLAYTNFNSSYSDTLGIFISTGCDPVFRCIYYKGGEKLSTMAPLQRPYLPRENEWRTEMIDLRDYDGEEFIQIAFVNFSGYGNTLFIDNIEVASTPQPAPIARFTASSTSVCAGSTVSFTDNSSDQPGQWVWSFPGGVPASDTSKNPVVTYEKPGTYDVILTAANKTGSNTVSMKSFIEVKPKAPLVLTASKTEICEGEEVTLTGSGLPSFNWNLSGAQVLPQGNTVTLTPRQDITYSIKGVSDGGCETVSSVTIRVKPGRTLAINPPSARICKGGEPVELNATGGRNYSWTPAVGLSSTN